MHTLLLRRLRRKLRVLMLVGGFAFASLPPLLAVRAAAADANAEPPGAVSVRWLPDPFANSPPRALDRRMTVEAGTTGRSPSVLLHVFDVEQDAVTLAGFEPARHGTVRPRDDGTFSYEPRAGFVGADSFKFTLRDARRATSSATMHVSVIRPSGQWSTTSFTGLAEIPVENPPARPVKRTFAPRAIDFDQDGKLDILAGAGGRVWLYRNLGRADRPYFAAVQPILAGGRPLEAGKGRTSIALADFDRDGRQDLAFVGDDRKVHWARRVPDVDGRPEFAAPVVAAARDGGDFVAPDVRVEVADWNGDGLPDVLAGTFSGAVQVAYNVGMPGEPRFAPPVKAIDSAGRQIEGSYNLNVRVADLNQDGVPDFVESYNWGTIRFHLNAGTAAEPRLGDSGAFSVSGREFAKVDLHALTDGPLVDFADFNGDQTIDLLVGGENTGAVRIAYGESGRSYLEEIAAFIARHPDDLGPYLADPKNEAERARMQTLQAALYDYVTTFATPGQKAQIVAGLRDLIARHPRYFRHQKHDLQAQPGIPSLAAQTYLTMLVADYDNPASRRALVEAAEIPGAYRKLVEELGLLYFDNANNPRGAEAIYQWLKTVPRDIYPGTGITANDWLGGGRAFLVRGHLKNTFNGSPIDRGEYGFGADARAVIGDRGSENQFMTVVHHEACHDLDAYVRQSPVLNRRWGRMLVDAGGPDMRADPETGWPSWEHTKRHFRDAGLWDGDDKSWDAALKKYWAEGRGAEWNQLGFMRGNISWFYGATQESLATQGNQHWNSTEGRLEVAISRWKRGFRSNLSEVLFFLEIWSAGLDKMTFCENDDACHRTFRFAKLRRNAAGYIDRIDLGERYYEFAVDDEGRVTELVHVPSR